MRVSVSMYLSRGEVEPMVRLAAHSPAFGAEVREDAKSVFVELPVGFGVPLAPIGAWR